MSLRNLVPPTTRKGPRCTVCQALRDLPDADANQLNAWLADRNVPFAAIVQVCHDDPDTPNLSSTAISRHARGLCGGAERLRD